MAKPPNDRVPLPTIPDIKSGLFGNATAVRLFQGRPQGLEPMILAQPRVDQFAIIATLVVTKVVDGGPYLWYAFVDYDGVDVSEDTAIAWKTPIGDTPQAFELNLVLDGYKGSTLSVQSGTGGAINFTAIGWIAYRE